jgi:uncharacterized protein (DUF3084 family)
MIELRVECRCPEYHLADLGLHLRRGDVVYLTETQANNSADLAYAKRISAVNVRETNRYQQARTPVLRVSKGALSNVPPEHVLRHVRARPEPLIVAPAPSASEPGTPVEASPKPPKRGRRRKSTDLD